MSTQNLFSWRNKKNINLIPLLSRTLVKSQCLNILGNHSNLIRAFAVQIMS